MEETIGTKLRNLNREFYESFASEFDGSRSTSDPALTCILPYVPSPATVLDVGCGNGRLAVLLDAERPGSTYVGLDASAGLIEIARRNARLLSSVATEFTVGDAVDPSWTATVAGAGFDVVVALAVVHHIPTYGARLRFVRNLARVAGRGARIIVSSWQFLDSPRLRKKVVPWSALGLQAEQVDEGDYLLDWRRGGHGLRYCHLVDETEMREMAAAARLRVHAEMRAGGREGNLSLVVVLEP